MRRWAACCAPYEAYHENGEEQCASRELLIAIESAIIE
jgi:hypothetical protein